MERINFIAIDFETATSARASVCEAGICVVASGKIVGKRSWLVQPVGNIYNPINVQIHGIRPSDTATAPPFAVVWREIAAYLQRCPVLVAHNTGFDMSCIRKSLELFHLAKPDITYYCSLRAARTIYQYPSNDLGTLCSLFDIPQGSHHRAGDDAEMCARLFLREILDHKAHSLDDMNFCSGKL